MTQLEIARKIAINAHEGQFRKMGEDKGKPYIVHPERVSKALEYYGNIFAASGMLHDVLEDTNMTEEDLRSQGVHDEVIDVVKHVTKRKGENYLDFILRIKEYSFATKVKIADLKDNMTSLQEGSLLDKYRMALWILTHECPYEGCIEE